jgi:hypothetical protein
MKTLITALTFLTLIAAPAFVPSAHAAPRSDRGATTGQASGSTYQGYPLSEWYRTDSW